MKKPSDYVVTHFRPDSALQENLSVRSGEKLTPGLVAKRDLSRLYALYGLVLPTFSRDEALVIVTVLHATELKPETSYLLPTVLRSSPDVDEELDAEFLERISKMGPLERMAIVDAVERFWCLDSSQSVDERLQMVGLIEPLEKNMKETLEAFLKSDDFKEGVISSTRASWGGSGYSVELFPDGHWSVLWNNQIGNQYSSPGVILKLPPLDFDPSDKDEYVDGGAGTEEEFLSEQFYLEESDNAQYLRDRLIEN